MQKNLLTLFLMLSISLLNAQDAGLSWVASIGGTTLDEGLSTTIDANGDLYIVGYFEETADFDPGSGTVDLTSTGNRDIFIQKLDANGNLLWVRSIGSIGNDLGRGVTTDASGNVYVTGSYESTVDFDPGPGTSELTPSTGQGVFVLKLDGAGDFVWAQNIESNGAGFAIVSDASGNTYTTGSFTQPLSFDGPTIFVKKLDANGGQLWEAIIGGSSTDEGRSIDLDANGNVYISGRFGRTVDFDPDIGVMELTAVDGLDIFVQKLSPDGGLIWARSMGGTDSDESRGVTIDASGNVYSTGTFLNTVDFDPGLGTSELTAIGSTDMYVQKLNSDGEFVWAKQVGGDFVYGNSIATDANGDVYVTGNFRGTGDFDPGSGTLTLNSTGIFDDAYIQKLDADGNLIWVKQIEGTDSEGRSLSTDADMNVYLTGGYGGQADFDPSTRDNSIASNVQSLDYFIMKLSPCAPSSSTNDIDACDSYMTPDGQVVTLSGTYTTTLANAGGCDSVVTINLTITSLTASISASGATLSASPAGASYQWIDCDNGNQAINGATSQDFTVAISGNYAVVVTENGCSDTSDCVSVIITSLPDAFSEYQLSVFPNPTNGTVHIDLGTLNKALVRVVNIYGQTVYSDANVNGPNYQFELDAQPGLYIVQIAADEQEFEYKILRQ